jgi:hypothetical protein
MKNNLRIAVFLLLVSTVPAYSQTVPVKLVKLIQFELQSSAVVSASGEELSTPGYMPKVYWFPVKVPSTVLTGLVANGIYPDPYNGMNNMLFLMHRTFIKV